MERKSNIRYNPLTALGHPSGTPYKNYCRYEMKHKTLQYRTIIIKQIKTLRVNLRT